MSMSNIVRKLLAPRTVHGSEEHGRGLTPNEVELLSYKKEEYRDNIKKELARYRKKKDKEMWGGSGILDHGNILRAKNVFKGK